MSRREAGVRDPVQERGPSWPLPSGHVLGSGAIWFPGVFDQHGCPLAIFPVEGQDRLLELCKEEVVDFINHFHSLLYKKQEKQSLVSVVADLRQASPPTIKLITDTLLLLQEHKRTVHSVYIIQPKRKDVAKLLMKLLVPSKSCSTSSSNVLLKDIPELWNYIDRSQLPASLGGYFLYCHKSWVSFIKEIDAFDKEFLSVVQRLPSCIATLQALSRLPLPSTFDQLQHFCSTNEAKFLQLRRDLGLDELLKHCENVCEKLRHPDREPCYQAMAGTPFFTQTAFDMLTNHSRITAAVEKVELLWKQAFSQAHLQLQVFQLRHRAMQIILQIEPLQEKLQLYKMEVAKDSGRAAVLLSEFEESYYAPAEALVGCAEDLIHRLEEILPVKFQSRESWAPDLERLKENLHSDVNFILHTLRAVSEYHHYYNKTNRWYSLVLRDSFLPELLSGLQGEPLSTLQQNDQMKTIPAWRRRLSTFLKKNPPPDLEELLHLSRLSASIPDGDVQQAGRRLSQRCMILRKLLISSGPVSVEQLQLALQWQYEALRCSHGNQSPESSSDSVSDGNLSFTKQNQTIPENWNPPTMVVPPAAADWKQSASSLFSGPHGLGGTQLQAPGGKDEVEKSLKSAEVRTYPELPGSLKESFSVISDEKHHCREFALRPAANLSSIQIIPKVEAESLNLEIKVKRSASPPTNPWLSLPVDELENSYTVTITPKPTPQKQSFKMTAAEQKPPSKNEALSCTEPRDPPSIDWVLHADSGWADPELSPIHNILSSTITDGRETSTCATDGVPTLLWDSYDLHEEKPEADSMTDMSSMDWELKEQENLREVERILTKADGILEEEENVLAQEAVLDALLRAGDEKDLWHLWHSEKQLEEPSFEPSDAGSSEDGPMLEGSDLLSEGVSAESTRYGEEDFSYEAETTDGRLELQEEPRNVPLLGPPSREENMNLQDLRRFTSQQPSAAFRLELEREKRKVEKLEKSLEESSEWRNETGASGRFSETESGDDGEPTELSETGSNESLGPVVDDDDEEEPLQCHGRHVGGSGRNLLLCDTKASSSECSVVPPVVGSESPLTSELMQQEGGFDPGGRPAWPEPGSLPVDGPPPTSEEEAEPAALGVLVEGVTLDDRKNIFNPNLTEHINNNNNNLSVYGNLSGRADCEEDSYTRPLLTDVQQTKPDLQPVLQMGPSQRLEFDPGGPEELVSDGVRISDHGEQRNQLWAESFTEIADFKIPVILDVGSGLMKAGFSDQDQPNIKFPTITGVPKYEEIMNGTLEREIYIGHDAQHMRGVLTLRHPIRNGIISNWDDMEKIWHYTFQQLCVDPEDHPVLLTEAAMNPLENRQRMVEIMFERFGVPFAYVAMQAVLALYAAGRTTGVVFDSGEGVSHSVPVFEGYGLPHAIQRFPLAGCDVTAQLKKLLQEQGVSMRTTAEEEIVREMKERCCCVALDYEADMNPERSSCREMLYTLPDGQIITLGTERFRAPEILFKPELIGRDHYGMHESVFKSVLRSDIDLRRSFLANIVLSGGNTLLPGLPERLQAEVKNLLPSDMRAAVRVTSPKDRDFLVWSGGAVLANLSTFSSAWISQAEYDEHGPQIVFRKCF